MLAETQRRSALAAMGIDVYLLRVRAAAGEAAAIGTEGEGVDLVVACAHDASATPAAQRMRILLPLALGIATPRVHWISADARGDLAEPPAARTYLALGAQMPRALGANLSTQQQKSATIAAADAPAANLRNALSKRALWQALKPLAWRLRAAN